MVMDTTTRKAAPYETNCTSNWDQTGFIAMHTLNYTLNVQKFLSRCLSIYSTFQALFQKCQRFCIQDAIQNSCGCFHAAYLNDVIDWTSNATTPCYVSSDGESDMEQNQYSCVMGIYQKFDNATLVCNGCRVPCRYNFRVFYHCISL